MRVSAEGEKECFHGWETVMGCEERDGFSHA